MVLESVDFVRHCGVFGPGKKRWRPFSVRGEDYTLVYFGVRSGGSGATGAGWHEEVLATGGRVLVCGAVRLRQHRTGQGAGGVVVS